MIVLDRQAAGRGIILRLLAACLILALILMGFGQARTGYRAVRERDAIMRAVFQSWARELPAPFTCVDRQLKLVGYIDDTMARLDERGRLHSGMFVKASWLSSNQTLQPSLRHHCSDYLNVTGPMMSGDGATVHYEWLCGNGMCGGRGSINLDRTDHGWIVHDIDISAVV